MCLCVYVEVQQVLSVLLSSQKSFLFKYAVIMRKADWYRWVCMCFDSVDILCTVTVSLLANYHGKQMGQVAASSPKETGDLKYAEDEAR